MRTLLLLAAACGLAGAASAQTPQIAADRLEAFINELSHLGPGYAVVVVSEDEVLLNHVEGVRRASTGAPLTVDTPMYVASQTKAYLGLLAARLDAEGVLSLDRTIAQTWPDIDLPDGIDPAAYTLRDLLSHQFPVRAAYLNIIQANVRPVATDDYPRLLSAFGQARDPGYRYDNGGYNIYAAILEIETGRSWQDWLDVAVFDPLGLERTSARTSDFGLEDIGWGHRWLGPDDGWHDIPPKTDAVMQSAGGVVTSPNDLAAFLQLNLRGEGGGFTREMVETAHTGLARTGLENDRWNIELGCSEYSLGWNICEHDGNTVYVHGGSYSGARSVMAFSHDLGIGIGVFSNSDNQTGWINSNLAHQYLQFLTDDPEAENMRARRVEEWAGFVEEEIELNLAAEQRRLNHERWGGWTWQPTDDELAEYTGIWSTGEVYLDLRIEQSGDRLVARWYNYLMPLEPAQPDLFAGRQLPLESLSAFVFNRAEDGSILNLDWDGDVYRRVGE